MAEASKPQRKRRPKPAPEPTFDEDSHDYDDAEYESYDAIEEYQPLPRRSSGKKKRSSSKSSGLSIPWKKIGSILGTVLVVLFIAGRIVRVIGRVDQAIGGGQAAVVTGSQALTEYVSVDGGFRAKMPTPVSENHTTNGPEKLWSWHVRGNQCIFAVSKKTSRIGIPGEVQVIKNMYDPAAPGNVVDFGFKGEVTSETSVTWGGHEAVELELTITEPDQSYEYSCVRIAIVGSHVWQAKVGASEPIAAEIKDEFFNSFQFSTAPEETVESQAAVTSPSPENQRSTASAFDS